MSNRGNAKKRRVGGGARKSADNGESGSSSELAAIKSMMQELVNQNRTQTNMMQSMQGEITRLKKKCNTMETTMKSVKSSQEESLAAIKTIQSAHDTKSDNMKTQLNVVENKQKYHDIILQNQKWVYSAKYPSEEYWDSLNEDEHVVARKFLRKIKKCTEEMRYGQNGDGDGDISISIPPELPYSEEFLPHWKEFASALEQHQYYLNVTEQKKEYYGLSLLLFNVELPKKIINMLSNALTSTQFRGLCLVKNNFGQDGIDFALKYLKRNKKLKEFCLQDNPINNMDDINKLCESIEQHPSVQILGLNGCKGEDINGCEMLKKVINAGGKKLKVIDVAEADISTKGGTFISNFLAANPLVETLNLFQNRLDDNDALSIARALKHNENLRRFDITRNDITKTGWKAIRRAEFDDTSLNAASDSNHTCNIIYPPDGSDEIEGVDTSKMNGDGSTSFNVVRVRQKKVYSILSSRNRECSNAGHFDDVPVEILPDMLHSIQTYCNYHVWKTEEEKEYTPNQNGNHVNPLSLVYEICRHWEEALAVFEALSS